MTSKRNWPVCSRSTSRRGGVSCLAVVRWWRVKASIGPWLLILSSACTPAAPRLAPSEPPQDTDETHTNTDPAPNPDTAPAHVQDEARELYRLAEARYADNDPVGAVGLLEQSLTAMGPDVDPALRHQLEARLTFLQLTSWATTGDLGFVLSARQRLFTRLSTFVETAQSLSPEQAEAMRGELFEQLGDVEAQLTEALGPEDDSVQTSDAQFAVLAAASEVSGQRGAAKQTEDDTTPTAKPSRGRRDEDGGEIRDVVVKTDRQRRLEDPEVQQRIRSNFSRPGPDATRPKLALVHGDRGLVRVLKASDGAGRGAVTRARRLIRDHRGALTDCYESALARSPVWGLRLQLNVTSEQGRITDARVTDGALVDIAGDACLTDALVGHPAPELPDGATTLKLVFFVESALRVAEDTVEFLAPGQRPTKKTEAAPSVFDAPRLR